MGGLYIGFIIARPVGVLHQFSAVFGLYVVSKTAQICSKRCKNIFDSFHRVHYLSRSFWQHDISVVVQQI